jgi:TolB-like protein/DNA-binding winged helix-turn-helix (wHTH) protein/Flp pilus assembly protein TadD
LGQLAACGQKGNQVAGYDGETMIYRAGSVEIDPANFSLTKGGKSISVEPLVFDLIVYLVENRDRVLTRQELLDTLWAGRIVSDTSLSNHVKSARKALGDDGQRQEFIKTIHSRGYRFVAKIEEAVSHDASEHGVSADPGLPVQKTDGSSPKRGLFFAATVLLIIAIGSSAMFFRSDDGIESIAVLPLKDLSSDPAQKYFVEGMQDALITRLSRTTDLRVISKTSTLRYATGDKSIPEIARELNVDALIEGSVLRDGDTVRITAQLIRGREDEQVWAKSYDRDLGHILALINDLSLAIAGEVKAAVRQQDTQEWTVTRPVTLQAHELVLQGRHYFDRFAFDKSLFYYQKAVDLDPEFAPAHAGVAGSFVASAFFGQIPAAVAVPKARKAALRAITLDTNSAGGYSSLGFIQLYYDWDWEAATKSLLRALELSPNDARTRHAYADYLMVMGDLGESLNQVEIGRLYDPVSPMANSVVDFHRILMRQYDAVIEDGRKAVAANPELMARFPYFHEALWLKGLHEEALAAYKASWGKNPELLQAMERGYAESGYTGAIHHLAEALASREAGPRDPMTLAKLYARAGEPDTALVWLERAYQYRQPQLLHVRAMPDFDGLHAAPEFQDLLRRVGFPDEPQRRD